jgi:hypothetical protein
MKRDNDFAHVFNRLAIKYKITEATLVSMEIPYEYRSLDDGDFQFGMVGNVPTTYETEDVDFENMDAIEQGAVILYNLRTMFDVSEKEIEDPSGYRNFLFQALAEMCLNKDENSAASDMADDWIIRFYKP